MPTSLLGLAVLLVIVPGLGYQLGRESKQPTRELAGLRETVSLIFAGLVSTSVGLFAFGLVRWIAPSNTPDVGLFLRTPGLYFRDQLPYLASWTAAIIALSTGLAFFAGRHLPRNRGGLAYASAWWRVFEIAEKFKAFKGYKIYVGCELTDGSYVSGRLWSYNATVKETPDRDIVLTAPITHRPSDANGPVPLKGVSILTLSASRVKFLTVTYVNEDNEHQTLPAT